MSQETTVIFNQVSKCYRRGQGRYFHRSFIAQDLFRRARPSTDSDSHFWALNKVSFQVNQGETVGFIGSNGAGKSTILKLIAQITTPTEGRIGVRGTVGSLLEIGTGFHPDLTGRENIYLAGSLLGMREAEIKKKFAAIVDFARLEPIIETPVKHYSTGQYMRLGFSVAVHLDHEVIIVDEVLAVGDLAFQTKCVEKMHSLKAEGRTILFVSHKLEQVKEVCSSVIWLEDGKVVNEGDCASLVPQYEAFQLSRAAAEREEEAAVL